jgi:hypothetical protein
MVSFNSLNSSVLYWCLSCYHYIQILTDFWNAALIINLELDFVFKIFRFIISFYKENIFLSKTLQKLQSLLNPHRNKQTYLTQNLVNKAYKVYHLARPHLKEQEYVHGSLREVFRWTAPWQSQPQRKKQKWIRLLSKLLKVGLVLYRFYFIFSLIV